MIETKVHYLKTHQTSFIDMFTKTKTFELRPDDRNFEVGDYLYLKETRKIVDDGGLYTGNYLIARIRYMMSGSVAEEYGMRKGYCVLGISFLNPQVQIAIKDKTYRWSDTYGIVFSSEESSRIVNELTRYSTVAAWAHFRKKGIVEEGLTKEQIIIFLIRKAEQWRVEEKSKFMDQILNLREQAIEFEKWLGI